MRAYMPVGAQTGQLASADLIFVDQLILGYVLFFHCGPQFIVSDQTYLLKNVLIGIFYSVQRAVIFFARSSICDISRKMVISTLAIFGQ